ncbi:UNVERIFIED_CONTAM: hypothetical protein GTU68_051041, partial [Idotea baltica]|nr:hypothetical protein [Idotea baltica]
MNINLKILRSLIHELRIAFPRQKKITESAHYEYILNQYRQNTTTDLQYCREKDEILFMAKTFTTYLNSRRELQKILADYKGKGERSTEEAAKMVGFILPPDTR